jgi:tetratricopeptide (TPR) repeat protein
MMDNLSMPGDGWRNRPVVLIAILLLGCVMAMCSAQPAPQDSVEQLWQQAAQAQQAKDYSRAASFYRKILTIDPGLTEAEVNLCIVLHLAGNLPDAVNCFDKVTAKHPDLFGPNFLAGMDYLKLDHPDRALPYLKRAAQESPDKIEVRLGLANAELQVRRYAEARDEFELVTKMNAQDSEAWNGLGAAYLSMEKELEAELRHATSPFRATLLAESYAQQGRTEKAVAILTGVVAGEPKVPCARSILGFTYLAQSKLDEAGQQFSLDWDKASGEGCLLAQLGMASLAAKRANTDESLQRLREAAAIDADAVIANRDLYWSYISSAGLEDRANAILKEGRRQSAADKSAGASLNMKHGRYSACSSALDGHPEGVSVPQLRVLAMCSYYSGDDDRVMTATRRILKSVPRDAEALYWQIQSTQRLGTAAITRASEINPESPSLHKLMADLLQEKGDLAEAAAEYRKAIALKPDFLAAHVGLARALNSDKKFEEAEQEARLVLNASPKDPEANFLMGEILINRSEAAKALPFLLNAQHAAPEELVYVHADLSMIYEESGDIARAIAELKQAISADVDGSYHYRLGRLYQKTGDRAAANAALQIAEKLRRQTDASSLVQK